MIHLDIAVGQKNLTPTPSVFRNLTPPKNLTPQPCGQGLLHIVQVVFTRKVYRSLDLQVKNHECFMKLIM